MNKSWFYLGAISIVATFLTSCGESPKPPAPAATPAPAAAAPPAVTPPTVPATPIAAATPTPKASGKSVSIKPVSVDVAAGLIAPTDGTTWAKTVSKGRVDPFAMIALQPIEVAEVKDPFNPTVAPVKSQIASNSLPKQTAPAASSSPIKVSAKKSTVKISSRSVNVAQSQPTVTIGGKSAKTSKISAKGKIASNISTAAKKPTPGKNTQISALPKPAINPALPKIINDIPPARPDEANAMEVSGVIEVAGTTQVIVKLASESFSRYIEVGDRVANGKVLIKRVEGQNTLSPTVVLEEVGVEVPRKIGDRISKAEGSPTPTSPITPVATPK